MGLGGASTDLLAQHEGKTQQTTDRITSEQRRFMESSEPHAVRKKLANPQGSARQKSEDGKKSRLHAKVGTGLLCRHTSALRLGR